MNFETGQGLRSDTCIAPRIADGDGLRNALSACTDLQLLDLIDATDAALRLAPEVVTWIEAALLREWNRRTGFTYDLHPPSAMAVGEHHAFARAAAAMQRALGCGFPAIRALFAEFENALTREARSQ